jgi:glycosyl transferase family 87
VPGLLLLVARDLLVHDPPRVLAWRLLHQQEGRVPALLAPLLPRLPAGWDRDPIALLLGAAAAALALAYAGAAMGGARPAVRAVLLGVAAAVLVVLPTLAFAVLGIATGRPYGQDGGVVQLPLAIDKILAGQSPYGADYSDSILGKEARVSDFWAPYGGNPILHHHAYLPGTHLVMMPFHLAARAWGAPFDPRLVTLLAWAAAALLAGRLPDDPARRLAAAAAVAVNPLIYWQQIFGANDLIVGALLLLTVRLGKGRPALAAAVLGFACATKQLAWPFAPFLMVHLAAIRALGELRAPEARRRLGRVVLACLGTAAAVVVPVAALDPRAFWADIVVYNLGLPGGQNYPLGGTPGFGFANFLIYAGRVTTLREDVPLGLSGLLLIPLALLLLRRQLSEGTAAGALVGGATMLLASLYFSRVVHANYLILAAALLPAAALATAGLAADLVAVPLLLLAFAVEVVDNEVFRATWDQAVASGLPARLPSWAAAVAPRAGPGLTADPLGLLVGAVASGLAILYLVAAVFGAPARARVAAILVMAAIVVVLPTAAVVGIGKSTGVVRSQDRWTARLVQDDRLMGAAPVPPVAEAWSTSFQRDPPARMVVAPPLSPGSAAASRALRSLRWDPRALSLVALAAIALLLPRLVAAADRPLALGAALLSPLAAVGTIFGAGDAVLLAALLGAVWLSRSVASLAAGLAVGCADAILPRALLAAPFLLLPLGAHSGSVLPLLLGVAVGWGLMVAPLLAAGPGALAASLLPAARIEPGLGLANVLLYFGEGGATAGLALGLLTAAVAAAGAIAALRSRAAPPRTYALAGTMLLAGLIAAPASSPHDLAAPAILLLLGVIGDRAQIRGEA